MERNRVSCYIALKTCYIALMPIVQVEAWKCSGCSHIWLKGSDELPVQCARCRSRKWNEWQGLDRQVEVRAETTGKPRRVQKAVTQTATLSTADKLPVKEPERVRTFQKGEYGTKKWRDHSE